MFTLHFSNTAKLQLEALRDNPALSKRHKAFLKTLALLEHNPRHPGLNTHKYSALSTKEMEVFEAYAENKTPGAYRVFWHYGPEKKIITIISITPHP
jgi:hypothetical protein